MCLRDLLRAVGDSKSELGVLLGVYREGRTVTLNGNDIEV